MTFSPLLQQISIGVGAFLVGLLVGLLRNRSRLRAVRRRGADRAERLEAELAIERLRITDLKTRVASFEGDRAEWAAHLEATGLAAGPAAGPAAGAKPPGGARPPDASSPPARPNRVASPRDRTSESAPSRA